MAITIHELKCERCGHYWLPRHPEPPKVCPVCKSDKWREPREHKSNNRKAADNG